jgi:hypothetical protein
LLILSQSLFGNAIENEINYYYNKPYEYEHNSIGGETKQYIDQLYSLPDNINIELKKLLKEKAGEKWFYYLIFIRAIVFIIIKYIPILQQKPSLWFKVKTGVQFISKDKLITE